MEDTKMTERELLDSFNDAMKNGHIYVVYQPKMNHSTGRMIGAEALMRWRDPIHGIQYPSDFIPVLEESRKICEADLHVFETVCRFQRKCLDMGISTVPISINMSRYDIYSSDYADKIEQIRLNYNVPIKLLHVEITESSAIGGMELVTNALRKLHGYGYIVEMDDFGSGYSSLNMLTTLPMDALKLDMTLIRHIADNERDLRLLTLILDIARSLALPVVAEGVETQAQYDLLKKMDCDCIQGFFFSKAVPPNEFSRFLHGGR